MSSELSKEEFDTFAEKAWSLAQISMRHLIVRAPVPSYVRTLINDGDLVVEPVVYLEQEMPKALQTMPSLLSIIVSKSEPYQPNADYGDGFDGKLTLYSTTYIDIDVENRATRCIRSATIDDDDHGTITPETVEISPKRGKSRFDKAWSAMVAEDFTVLDQDDVRFYLNVIDNCIVKVLDEQLSDPGED